MYYRRYLQDFVLENCLFILQITEICQLLSPCHFLADVMMVSFHVCVLLLCIHYMHRELYIYGAPFLIFTFLQHKLINFPMLLSFTFSLFSLFILSTILFLKKCFLVSFHARIVLGSSSGMYAVTHLVFYFFFVENMFFLECGFLKFFLNI